MKGELGRSVAKLVVPQQLFAWSRLPVRAGPDGLRGADLFSRWGMEDGGWR
jgi:hypothetical protein